METPTHLVQVLRGEVERLTQYLQILPSDAWRRPSACALWEVRDVVGHLTGMAERFHGTVARAVRGDVSPPAGSPPVGTSTQAGRRAVVARGAIARRESLATSYSRLSKPRWTSSWRYSHSLARRTGRNRPTVPCGSCRSGPIPP